MLVGTWTKGNAEAQGRRKVNSIRLYVLLQHELTISLVSFEAIVELRSSC